MGVGGGATANLDVGLIRMSQLLADWGQPAAEIG
jgi:hypothetical protein